MMYSVITRRLTQLFRRVRGGQGPRIVGPELPLPDAELPLAEVGYYEET